MTIAKMLKRASTRRTKVDPEPAPKRAIVSRRERQDSEAEIAGYIAQLTAEMGNMAGAARLDLLAYFLSLARLEAETIARRQLLEELGG